MSNRTPSSSPSPLSPAQQQVVQALAQGSTITAAATAAGLHRTTIYKWFENADFHQAVKEARADYILTLRDQMKELSGLAIDGLRRLLSKPETKDNILMHTSLAVLRRPRYPKPAWILPDQTGPSDDDKLRKELLMLELDSRGRLDQATVDRIYHEF